MKLKRSSLENLPASEPKAGGAFISARHRNPEEEIALVARKPDILGAVCAILATGVMFATVVILYMNWDAIRLA
ncbi:MAG: hypothetical protein WCP12_17350 [bacterium]